MQADALLRWSYGLLNVHDIFEGRGRVRNTKIVPRSAIGRALPRWRDTFFDKTVPEPRWRMVMVCVDHPFSPGEEPRRPGDCPFRQDSGLTGDISVDDVRYLTTLLDINTILSYLAIVITIGVLALIAITVILVSMVQSTSVEFDVSENPPPKERTPAPIVGRRLTVVPSAQPRSSV
jgi:hypothetical protein